MILPFGTVVAGPTWVFNPEEVMGGGGVWACAAVPVLNPLAEKQRNAINAIADFWTDSFGDAVVGQ